MSQTPQDEVKNDESNELQHRQDNAENGRVRLPRSREDILYGRAWRLVQAQKYDAALRLLNSGPPSDVFKNLKGVCLLRMGQYTSAVRVLRNLVLQTGCTWARRGIPVIFQTNLCTALLLAGHPLGCLELLADVQEQQHPSVLRLRRAIAAWKQELSFWQRVQWCCGLEPNHAVRLNFTPGDFETNLGPLSPQVERRTDPPQPRSAA